MARKRVVIIGGGFGGLTAARSLRRADVVLIDRTNHHLFQPLLYQVATAALSPGDIAWPLRTVFRPQTNVHVMMDEVTSIDRTARLVMVRNSAPIAFDILVVAPGSRHAYFGHDEWEPLAPGLKTMTDAVRLREKMLFAFEDAERRRAATGAQERLTFVIVGGGPTGVELAGALAEIGRKAMGPDFPSLRLDDLSILLVEGGLRILPGFSEDLSAKASTALMRMGVTIKLKSLVSEVRENGVMIGEEFVPSTNIIWAAGNRASPLLSVLSSPEDASGRINVQSDLTIPGDPWIFVIGDAAHCVGRDGKPLPGLAPVAMQQGHYVADLITKETAPERRRPFVYADRGMLTTIGRAKAVAQLGPLHVYGLLAWLLWCIVHIFFLIGFRNRVRVMLEWMWYYVTFKPGARLLFEQPGQPHSEPRTRHPSSGQAISELTTRGLMKPRITMITIGVDDLERSLMFYRDGLGLPTRGIVGTEFEHGAVAFFDLLNGLKLAIWARKDMAHEAKVPLGPRSATEFTIGHNVSSKAEVDEVIEKARRAGAVITDPPHDAFWGGYTGSFQDPDGHLWEVAWNPEMDIAD